MNDRIFQTTQKGGKGGKKTGALAEMWPGPDRRSSEGSKILGTQALTRVTYFSNNSTNNTELQTTFS
ncbi:hypothetical protein HI914_00095 [Erysiphe necator]|nr:hypothetical protein HI914_00095 [Erysiphe necator]